MEVYGEKPKKFTKAWWEYFWYYYKWHTIAVIFAIIVITYTSVQCALNPKYDLTLDFIAENGVSEEVISDLENIISQQISDADGNGKTETFILNMTMYSQTDPQVVQAMQTKLMLEPTYSEAFVFILSEKYADIYREFDVWESTSVFSDKDCNDKFFAQISDSPVLKQLGINTENQDLYICVRKIRDNEKDDEYVKLQHDNAIKIAQFFVGE